jgi:hypothetical protein
VHEVRPLAGIPNFDSTTLSAALGAEVNMSDMIPMPMAENVGAVQTASREIAEMQTRYLMAQRFPRNERTAFDKICNAFQRPGLAERAQYQFAKGGTDIAGPSIHAAEAMAVAWGNMGHGWRELSRHGGEDPYSEVEAYAVDFESRAVSSIQFVVRHIRDTSKGQKRLRDERDVYELCANQAQRRKRACILALLPQDVKDKAMAQAEETLNTSADTSEKAQKAILEHFAVFNVTKGMIEKRIQRRIDSITPAQVVSLRRIHNSLRDGMSSPEEWFEADDASSAGVELVKSITSASTGISQETKS